MFQATRSELCPLYFLKMRYVMYSMSLQDFTQKIWFGGNSYKLLFLVNIYCKKWWLQPKFAGFWRVSRVFGGLRFSRWVGNTVILNSAFYTFALVRQPFTLPKVQYCSERSEWIYLENFCCPLGLLKKYIIYVSVRRHPKISLSALARLQVYQPLRHNA